MPAAPFAAAALALTTAQTISAATAQRRQLSSQAAFQQQQAERSRAINEARDRQLVRNQSRELAAGRARIASSGIDPAVGSGLLLLESQSAINEFDRLLARAIGEQGSLELDQQARLNRMRASSAQQQGLLTAGSTVATKGPKVYADLEKYLNEP